MNKKMIFAIAGIVVLAFLIVGGYKASQLKIISITKKIIINGSQEKVFDMVRYLSKYPKWSPFLAQDPTQEYAVKGTDGVVGAQFHWKGDNGKEQGYQEITTIEPYRFIGIRCNIQKPFKALPTFDYTFSVINGNVEVVQHFKLESGIVDAFFMWLFGAKSEMDKTNQQGMELLKKAVENK